MRSDFSLNRVVQLFLEAIYQAKNVTPCNVMTLQINVQKYDQYDTLPLEVDAQKV